MSRSRTYTKSEIADAAAAAASYDVRVVMHPTGEIEFTPKRFLPAKGSDNSAEAALDRWKNAREVDRSS